MRSGTGHGGPAEPAHVVLDQTARGSDRRGRLAGTVEPRQIRLFAEPDQLAAGVVPVLLGDERARRRLVADAVQMLERLTVDEPAERTRRLRNAARQQRADFVQQPAVELLVDPPRDALGDRGGRQTDGDAASRRRPESATRSRRNARSAGVRSGRTLRAPGRCASDPSAGCGPPTADRRARSIRWRNAHAATRRRCPRAAAAARASRPGPGNRPRVNAR